MLTIGFVRDSINELRVKHTTTKSKELQSPVRSEAAHCVLSHNNPLHK